MSVGPPPSSPFTESNRRPSPYHGDALPTELKGQRSRRIHSGSRDPEILRDPSDRGFCTRSVELCDVDQDLADDAVLDFPVGLRRLLEIETHQW